MIGILTYIILLPAKQGIYPLTQNYPNTETKLPNQKLTTYERINKETRQKKKQLGHVKRKVKFSLTRIFHTNLNIKNVLAVTPVTGK